MKNTHVFTALVFTGVISLFGSLSAMSQPGQEPRLEDVTGRETAALLNTFTGQVKEQALVVAQAVAPALAAVQASYAQRTSTAQWIEDAMKMIKDIIIKATKKSVSYVAQNPVKFVKSVPVMIVAALYVLIRCGGINLILQNIGFLVGVVKRVFFDACAVATGISTLITIFGTIEMVLKWYRESTAVPAPAQPVVTAQVLPLVLGAQSENQNQVVTSQPGRLA